MRPTTCRLVGWAGAAAGAGSAKFEPARLAANIAAERQRAGRWVTGRFPYGFGDAGTGSRFSIELRRAKVPVGLNGAGVLERRRRETPTESWLNVAGRARRIRVSNCCESVDRRSARSRSNPARAGCNRRRAGCGSGQSVGAVGLVQPADVGLDDWSWSILSDSHAILADGLRRRAG